jgi:hypothetical protein
MKNDGAVKPKQQQQQPTTAASSSDSGCRQQRHDQPPIDVLKNSVRLLVRVDVCNVRKHGEQVGLRASEPSSPNILENVSFS